MRRTPIWRIRTRLGRRLLASAALVLGGVAAIGEPADDPREPTHGKRAIEAMIAALDDDVFAVRDRARKELLNVGEPAIPALLQATRSDSPEQRTRARELVATIRSSLLNREWQTLGAQVDDDLDVEHGMWLAALILDPGLAKESVTMRLDEMAKAGAKLNRFYSAAPVCSPTRGSCLTGRHPFRYGIYSANTGHMKPQELTLAELLKKQKHFYNALSNGEHPLRK